MSENERHQLKLMNRVRKTRGQLDAVERALQTNQNCGDVLMLLAAVKGAVSALMAEVMEDHIRDHLTDSSRERIAPELAEDLIDLIRSYVK